MIRRILREPLLHFLLLGAALFAFFAWRNRGEPVSAAPNDISIGAPQIESLVAGFERTWQRPPNREELDGLIQDFITEEVLCREARALGLDQDDIVIRRRLRQKMEFLAADVATLAELDDAALAKYFAENAAKYAEPPRLSFTHVYFSREKRGANLEADAKTGLTTLAQSPEAAGDMGDPSLLPMDFAATPGRDIGAQFGSGFAEALLKLPLDQWQGPVASSYGLHLVRVTARTDPPAPELATVRDAVRRDLQNAQREELNRRTLEEFKKRYQITVDEAAVQRAAAAGIADSGP